MFVKISSKFFFRRRKMKCRESSETRFGQVSRQSEPCSGGKRPFKVFAAFGGKLLGRLRAGGPTCHQGGRFAASRWQELATLSNSLDFETLACSRRYPSTKAKPIVFSFKKTRTVQVVFGPKSRFATHIESFTPPPRKSPQK